MNQREAAPFVDRRNESQELQYKRGLLQSAKLMEERLEEAATSYPGLEASIEAAARLVDALSVEVGVLDEIENG